VNAREATPLQAFTLAIDSAAAELAAAADLRTLEEGSEIARRVFARHIAPAWAAEVFEGRRAA
jgi:hypothetical protein